MRHPLGQRMPGCRTLAIEGSKSIRVTSAGRHKKCYTSVLGALADGTKLPVLVLLPGVRPPPKDDIPHGILIHVWIRVGQKELV